MLLLLNDNQNQFEKKYRQINHFEYFADSAAQD